MFSAGHRKKTYARDSAAAWVLAALQLEKTEVELLEKIEEKRDDEEWQQQRLLREEAMTREWEQQSQRDAWVPEEPEDSGSDEWPWVRPVPAYPPHEAENTMMAQHVGEGGEGSIAFHRRALQHQPHGHPAREATLYSLGSALLERYQREGGETNRLEAVEFYQDAFGFDQEAVHLEFNGSRSEGLMDRE